MTHNPTHWICAALCVGLWLALTLWIVAKVRRDAKAAKARAAAMGDTASDTVLLAYGSQTGTAENLAWDSAEWLSQQGTPARPVPLSELTHDVLAAARTVLFVASTTGEGDAPDNASGFLRRQMTEASALPHLSYGVLALGDSSYDQYCGFGRQLEAWLTASAAKPLFSRIEVDNNDPVALAAWQGELAKLAGAESGAGFTPAPFQPWQLVRKTHMNPGSPGGEAWHLVFAPVGHRCVWEAGDIAEIALPSIESTVPVVREYSLASVPADGAAEFCIRLMTTPEGGYGLGSGWLIRQLKVDEVVQMRIRPNRSFRPAPDAAPIILIGNGTGIAGLRAHLKVPRAGDAWLLFGERTSAHDNLFGEELKAMQAAGQIARVDHAWSRDDGDGRYVQHLVSEHARDIVSWIERGAYVFVCGSLEGMSQGVHAALETVLGEDTLQGLIDAGRYRRDVY